MRTTIGTSHKAFLISLSIAAGLVGCGGPPVQGTIVPLSKDSNVPLLLLVQKQGEYWCPVKVVSIAEEQCEGNPPAGPDHLACRNRKDPIRWFAHDESTHENPGIKANFEITFKTGNEDPLEKWPDQKCNKSVDGALDCQIREKIKNKLTAGSYDYTVTMIPPSPCPPLDPRIYVNP